MIKKILPLSRSNYLLVAFLVASFLFIVSNVSGSTPSFNDCEEDLVSGYIHTKSYSFLTSNFPVDIKFTESGYSNCDWKVIGTNISIYEALNQERTLELIVQIKQPHFKIIKIAFFFLLLFLFTKSKKFSFVSNAPWVYGFFLLFMLASLLTLERDLKIIFSAYYILVFFYFNDYSYKELIYLMVPFMLFPFYVDSPLILPLLIMTVCLYLAKEKSRKGLKIFFFIFFMLSLSLVNIIFHSETPEEAILDIGDQFKESPVSKSKKIEVKEILSSSSFENSYLDTNDVSFIFRTMSLKNNTLTGNDLIETVNTRLKSFDAEGLKKYSNPEIMNMEKINYSWEIFQEGTISSFLPFDSERQLFMLSRNQSIENSLLAFIWLSLSMFIGVIVYKEFSKKELGKIILLFSNSALILSLASLLSIRYTIFSRIVNFITGFHLMPQKDLTGINWRGAIYGWRGIYDHYEIFSNILVYGLIASYLSINIDKRFNKPHHELLKIFILLTSILLTNSRSAVVITALVFIFFKVFNQSLNKYVYLGASYFFGFFYLYNYLGQGKFNSNKWLFILLFILLFIFTYDLFSERFFKMYEKNPRFTTTIIFSIFVVGFLVFFSRGYSYYSEVENNIVSYNYEISKAYSESEQDEINLTYLNHICNFRQMDSETMHKVSYCESLASGKSTTYKDYDNLYNLQASNIIVGSIEPYVDWWEWSINDYSDSYALPLVKSIAVISGPINRKVAWNNFFAGYKPNLSELFFGFGPSSQFHLIRDININYYILTIQNFDPHSSYFSVLSRLGLINFVLVSVSIIFSIAYLVRKKKIQGIILLLFFFLLELKTDSLNIPYVFLALCTIFPSFVRTVTDKDV